MRSCLGPRPVAGVTLAGGHQSGIGLRHPTRNRNLQIVTGRRSNTAQAPIVLPGAANMRSSPTLCTVVCHHVVL